MGIPWLKVVGLVKSDGPLLRYMVVVPVRSTILNGPRLTTWNVVAFVTKVKRAVVSFLVVVLLNALSSPVTLERYPYCWLAGPLLLNSPIISYRTCSSAIGMVICADATPAVIRTKTAVKQTLTRRVPLMMILLVLGRFFSVQNARHAHLAQPGESQQWSLSQF